MQGFRCRLAPLRASWPRKTEDTKADTKLLLSGDDSYVKATRLAAPKKPNGLADPCPKGTGAELEQKLYAKLQGPGPVGVNGMQKGT